MICDLHQLSTPQVRSAADTRAELLRLRAKVRIFIKAVMATDNFDRAELLRRAIKVTRLQILELI